MSKRAPFSGDSPGGSPPTNHTLTIILAGSGGGQVTAPGIDTNASDMTQMFPHGTVVDLSAIANGTSDFASWSVSQTGNNGTASPWQVTMNGARTVTVTFDLVASGTRICRKGTQEIEFNELMDPLDVPAQCIRFRIDVYDPPTASRGVTNQNNRIKLFLDQGIYCYPFLPVTAPTDQAYWNGIDLLMAAPDIKPIASGGRIEWYEVGNEPNGTAEWDTYFRRLYGTGGTPGAAERIHAAGGKVMLCHRLGGGATQNWLDRVRWDGPSGVDGVAYHIYNINAGAIMPAVQGFRNQVDQWGIPPGGGASKPLFLTEFGWHVSGNYTTLSFPVTLPETPIRVASTGGFSAPNGQLRIGGGGGPVVSYTGITQSPTPRFTGCTTAGSGPFPAGTRVYEYGPSGPVTEAEQANRLEQSFHALRNNCEALDLRIIGQFAATDYGPPLGNPDNWAYWAGLMATTDVAGNSILPATRKRPAWNRWKGLPETKVMADPLVLPGGPWPRSNAEAADSVVNSPWEPRPQNAAENAAMPVSGDLADWRAAFPSTALSHYKASVNGQYTGTTDEIIQWAAYKWGWHPDLLRAVAVKESWWDMDQLGDPEFQTTLVGNHTLPVGTITVADVSAFTETVERIIEIDATEYMTYTGRNVGANQFTGCAAHSWQGGNRLVNDGDIVKGTFHSYGLFQMKRPHVWTTPHVHLPRDYTAFIADFYGQMLRGYYDGLEASWMSAYDPPTGPNTAAYEAGDIWGCVGAWYSGRWHDTAAQGYIASVKTILDNREWEDVGF